MRRLHYNAPSAAMQQSCTGGQGNCFFSVNKEEDKQEENEEKVDEEENKQEEGDKIRTTMQSSAAVQQSCTCGEGNCSFLSRERGGGGR